MAKNIEAQDSLLFTRTGVDGKDCIDKQYLIHTVTLSRYGHIHHWLWVYISADLGT